MLSKQRKKQLLIAIIASVVPALFLIFSTSSHSHAAWIEPIYQVLANTSSGTGQIVARIWTTMMNVVNSFVLALLIYVAFMNILRIQLDSYAVKKFLPTFIMTIILANFSFLIARIIIDLGNMAITVFLHGDPANGMSGVFGNLIADGPPAPGTSLPAGSNYYGTIFSYTIKQLVGITGAVLMFILAIIFFIRNYMLYFLVAMAPLGFLAMALPLTKKYFQMWWSNFTKWVFMPVVSIFWLWLAGQFVSSTQAGGPWFLPVVFSGICFYLAITSPFKVGGAVLGAWTKYGKQAWGATGGKATKWAGQEAKERAGAAALSGKLAISRTGTYQRFLGDNSRIGRYRSAARANTARRKLFLEGPELVKKKREENARVDAAYDLAMDPRTPREARSRYRAIIRSWSQDDRKGKENRGLQDLVNSLRFNPDGTVVTSNNNQGVITGRRFTESGGLGDQASTLAQIAYLLRRPNTLDQGERQLAGNINAGNAVNVTDQNGVTTQRILEFLNTDNGTRVQDLRRLDANAFGTSPVPVVNDQSPAASAPGSSPAEEEISRGVRELVEEFRNLESNMGGEGSLGGEQGFDQLLGEISKMKPNLTLDGAGLAAMILPKLNVNIESMSPQALEQWGRKIKRVSEATDKISNGIEAENAAVLRQIANVIRDGGNPTLLAEGREAIGRPTNINEGEGNG